MAAAILDDVANDLRGEPLRVLAAIALTDHEPASWARGCDYLEAMLSMDSIDERYGR